LLKNVLLDLKKQGKTILFSTHRMDQVEKLWRLHLPDQSWQAGFAGQLKDIKAQYGKSNVQIEYDGDGRLPAAEQSGEDLQQTTATTWRLRLAPARTRSNSCAWCRALTRKQV